MKELTRRTVLGRGLALTAVVHAAHLPVSAAAEDPSFARIVRPTGTAAPTGALLIRGGTVLTMDAQLGDFSVGDVLVEGTKIVKVARRISAPQARVVDATGRIVMPGFVDTHRHAWEGQLKQINPNSADLQNYIAGTHASFATHYRPQDTYIGTLLTCLGAIDAGITTIVDNAHNTRSLAHARAAVLALRAAGLRAVHAPGSPLFGRWDKESWHADLATLQKEGFAADRGGLLTMAGMSGVDAQQWAALRRLKLPIVTEFFGKEMAAQLPTLDRDGMLGSDNIFNHCTDLGAEAWRIIKSRGVRVNVCPRSDAQWGLASGMFGYQDAVDHGLRPGLSVDNESAYGGDMFAEMRTALYLQRSTSQARRHRGDHGAPPPVELRRLLEAATIDGAAVAGLADRTGSLSEGKEADIVVINANDMNLYPSNNALGTVVQGAERSNVELVLIGGRVAKAGRRLAGVHRANLEQAVEASRRHLFRSAGFEYDHLAERFALKP